MRFLVIGDIHGNLEALEAVLRDAPAYDSVLCLGDTVGYGPNPNECVEIVRSLPGLVCLVGNHDLAALGHLDLADFNPNARSAAQWTGKQLTPESRSYLELLRPYSQDDSMYLAHASPRDPIWEYMQEATQGPPNFATFSQNICFVGHTHVPRVFEEAGLTSADVVIARPGFSVTATSGGRKIINPGGVGQPRDGDARASYGIYNSQNSEFVYGRVAYPVEITQKKILKADLPSSLAYRLASGI